jgi:hypothetical protein
MRKELKGVRGKEITYKQEAQGKFCFVLKKTTE